MHAYEIRDGKRVWPTCSECGCRLEMQIADPAIWGPNCIFLTHFNTGTDRDARGCVCTEIDTYIISKDGKSSTYFMY